MTDQGGSRVDGPLLDSAREDDVTHGLLVAMLKTYFDAREDREAGQSAMEMVAPHLRSYLEQHPGEELWDGEHRLRGWLQPRKGGKGLDGPRTPTELLRFLADHGALLLNSKVFKDLDESRQFPECLSVKDYLIPGEGSMALQVKQVG